MPSGVGVGVWSVSVHLDVSEPGMVMSVPGQFYLWRS